MSTPTINNQQSTINNQQYNAGTDAAGSVNDLESVFVNSVFSNAASTAEKWELTAGKSRSKYKM